MEILKKVDILGIPYEIKEVETIDKGTLIIGQINYLEQIILLDKSLPKEKKEQTLLHEILHGILSALGYDDINDDEHLVQSISSALYQVLRNQITFS